ncbi:probable methyltransferase-like protein 25 isoform X2 [Dysidea avara]|uniref:probable methyltransferase-like protein 25 isoform X2 n=1 Tax=Dysidea avara TaxID=196820 RepID=UPI00332094FE
MEKYSEKFVTQLIDFLAVHRWIYDVKVTELFKEQFWDRIPPHWRGPMLHMTREQLRYMPTGQVESKWPEDLISFVADSVEYGLQRHVSDDVVKATVPLDVSIVSRLAGYLMKYCKDCDVVLDIGSGLGYLGQCLAQQCGADVIGVECDSYRVDQGNKRHTDMVSSHKSTPLHHTSSPQECHSFVNPGSTKAANNHISLGDEIASKCSCCIGPSHLACDTSSVSMECVNKETQLSCKCIEHPHSIDELSLAVPTAKPCGCQPVENNDKHSTCLAKMTRSLQYSAPTRFVIKQLSLNFSDLCVQQLDDLVKQSIIPGSYHHRLCLVGLHCCGDLSAAVLNYFIKSSFIGLRSLVLFGCCYHKMSSSMNRDGSGYKIGSQFEFFPLSTTVKDIINSQSDDRPRFDFNVYAARLACQETVSRWVSQSDKDHDNHIKHVGYRAMFEAVVSTEHLVPKNCKQKVDHKQRFECWENYIGTTLSHYNLTDEHHSSLQQKLLEYYRSHHQYLSFIEPFTALQVCLQGVLEHLVMLDRLLYLKEHDLSSHHKAVFDDCISPRSVAIISHR